MRLIDADALTEFFKARMALWSSVDEVLDEISDAPSVEAEPVRRGKWIDRWFGYGYKVRCSKCGCLADIRTEYCSHCGARMDSEVE